MNPISKAISDITYRIPRDILQEVFMPKQYGFREAPVTIEEQIRNIVIKGRVMVDCDLVGGTETWVNLAGVPFEQLASDRFITVYYVPKSRTQGRTINSVLNMAYVSGPGMAYGGAMSQFDPCSVNEYNSAAKQVVDSFSSIPMVSTAHVQLIGENVVMVKETGIASGTGVLRVILANDENYSHLQIRSFPMFSRLCELACKAYIFNEYDIILDRGQITGGITLGKFREIVDRYSDAEEMYQTYLHETYRDVALMNDQESYNRLIQMTVGGPR